MPIENLVAYQDLPAGLVVERSWGVVDLGIDGGPMAGAYLRSADSTVWYGADWTGAIDDPTPSTTAAYWGPFGSREACEPYMLGQVVAMIASDGTDGTSDWFVAPENALVAER